MAEGRRARVATSAPRRSARRLAPPRLDAHAALFLDIDGTLLELALTPDRVRVDGGITELLPALASHLGGALALVTGRTIADADRLFPGLGLPVAGQHGVERRAADGTIHRHHLPPPGLGRLRANLERLVARYEGVLLEDKGGTLALHYRQAPGLASHVHKTLRAEMAAAARGRTWRLQSGKGIVEVRPDGRDKGTALDDYLREDPFRDRLPVFVGADRTDEFGFAAAARHGGWAVKVGPGPTDARYRLPNVAAVRHWLAAAFTVTDPDS